MVHIVFKKLGKAFKKVIKNEQLLTRHMGKIACAIKYCTLKSI